MSSYTRDEVRLRIPARVAFTPVAVGWAESSGIAYGFARQDMTALSLAVEEVFGYLCAVGVSGSDIEIMCRHFGRAVEIEFVFAAGTFDIATFNVTAATPDLLEAPETGLLIAARIVDRFRFALRGSRLHLYLLKEKTYSPVKDPPPPEVKELGEVIIREPELEEFRGLVQLARSGYDQDRLPGSFAIPAKAADMFGLGEYQALWATDRMGNSGAFILWRTTNPRLIEFFGPYVFVKNNRTDLAAALVEGCISSLARRTAWGMIALRPAPDLPLDYFEMLGSFLRHDPGGKTNEIPVYYRHLHEDEGEAVWAHPIIEEFLREQYERLFLARSIRLISGEPESATHAALFAEFNRQLGEAHLSPVWWGDDAAEVLRAHVRALGTENPNLFFNMDLGRPWHVQFAPVLHETGFRPRLILPHEGRADLLVFQWDPEDDRQ